MGRDAVTGLVVFATSLFLFWATLGLERHPMVPVGPGFYPQLVLGTTAVLALLLVVTGVIAHRRAPVPAASTRPNYALVVIAFAIFAVYAVALPWLGFRVATFMFLVAMPLALEPPRGARKRWVLVFIVALVATAAIYLIFERYLQVLLPRGRWTGF